MIQPAEEETLEVSYRWFRTCKDAEIGAGAIRNSESDKRLVPVEKDLQESQ